MVSLDQFKGMVLAAGKAAQLEAIWEPADQGWSLACSGKPLAAKSGELRTFRTADAVLSYIEQHFAVHAGGEIDVRFHIRQDLFAKRKATATKKGAGAKAAAAGEASKSEVKPRGRGKRGAQSAEAETQ